MFDAGKVRSVVFDLDDTIRINDPNAIQFLGDYLTSRGFTFDEERLRRSILWAHRYWASSEELEADIAEHGDLEDGFWHTYTTRHLEALGFSKEDMEGLVADVHAYMREHYQPESKLVPGARSVIQGLREGGYLVGVVTNRSRPIYGEARELDLDLDLDFFLTAGQMEAYKPDPRLFEGVLDLIQLPAEQVVYVGDNYHADVVGAANAGLQPVLMDPLGLYPEVETPSIKRIQDLLALLEIEALA